MAGPRRQAWNIVTSTVVYASVVEGGLVEVVEVDEVRINPPRPGTALRFDERTHVHDCGDRASLAVNWLTGSTRKPERFSWPDLARRGPALRPGQRGISGMRRGTVAVAKQFSHFHKSVIGNKVPLGKSSAHFFAREAFLDAPLGSLYGAGKGDFHYGMTVCGRNDEGEE